MIIQLTKILVPTSQGQSLNVSETFLPSFRLMKRSNWQKRTWTPNHCPDQDPGQQPFENSEIFWRGQIGRFIHTGYLVSSAKRLRVPGLSWAPETPFVTFKGETPGTESTQTFRAFHAPNSEIGDITEDGLWARWYYYPFFAQGVRAKISSQLLSSTRAWHPRRDSWILSATNCYAITNTVSCSVHTTVTFRI